MRWQSTTVRLGSIRLADGRHTIRVPYFQGPRDTVALTLEVAGPGEQPRIFTVPTSSNRHPIQRLGASLPNPRHAVQPDLPCVVPEQIEGAGNGRSSQRRRLEPVGTITEYALFYCATGRHNWATTRRGYV